MGWRLGGNKRFLIFPPIPCTTKGTERVLKADRPLLRLQRQAFPFPAQFQCLLVLHIRHQGSRGSAHLRPLPSPRRRRAGEPNLGRAPPPPVRAGPRMRPRALTRDYATGSSAHAWGGAVSSFRGGEEGAGEAAAGGDVSGGVEPAPLLARGLGIPSALRRRRPEVRGARPAGTRRRRVSGRAAAAAAWAWRRSTGAWRGECGSAEGPGAAGGGRREAGAGLPAADLPPRVRPRGFAEEGSCLRGVGGRAAWPGAGAPVSLGASAPRPRELPELLFVTPDPGESFAQQVCGVKLLDRGWGVGLCFGHEGGEGAQRPSVAATAAAEGLLSRQRSRPSR